MGPIVKEYIPFWVFTVAAIVWSYIHQIRSDQSLSCVRLFATPRIAARQASLSITNSQSLLRLMSIESVMTSNHLILLYHSPPAFNLSQHQGAFKWISSLHQVAKVLKFIRVSTSASVLPIFFCLSELKCINYLLRSWWDVLVGEHDCTVCAVPRVGQDLMDHKSHLSSGCAISYHLGRRSVVPGLKPDMRHRLPLFSLAFSAILWAGRGPKFLEQRSWLSGQTYLCSL